MHPIVKNILAVLAGIIIGGAVNMGIIMLSGWVIPPPGVDTSDMESLKSAMHLFEPRHFIMPFIAHAIGTLVGAFIAAKIAANNKMIFAMVIGIFFLIGGVMSVTMLPAPMWFNALDLLGAYIPMAWLGGRMSLSSSV